MIERGWTRPTLLKMNSFVGEGMAIGEGVWLVIMEVGAETNSNPPISFLMTNADSGQVVKPRFVQTECAISQDST